MAAPETRRTAASAAAADEECNPNRFIVAIVFVYRGKRLFLSVSVNASTLAQTQLCDEIERRHAETRAAADAAMEAVTRARTGA
jgi:hypothetical protein